MDNKNNWFMSSGSSKIKDSAQNSHVFQFIRGAHSFRILQILAGVFEIILGVSVITISVVGLIQPFWLSAVLSIIASVSTMIGLYLVYIMLSKSYNPNSLIRNAIRRVMKARN